jgi:hypothetical protein
MKMFLPVLVMASAFLMTGCSTTINKSQKSGSLDVKVKSDLQADMEVDMSKKIIGTAFHTKLFGLFDIKTSQNYADGVGYDGVNSSGWFSAGVIEETKSAAAYNAVVPNKADVIVAPQYLIKVKSYFLGAYKEVTAQVSGYAGRIKNISAPVKR